MRWTAYLLALCLGGISPSHAQDDESDSGPSGLTLTNSLFTLDGTLTSEAQTPTGDYQSYSTTITLSGDGSTVSSGTMTDSGSAMATQTGSNSSSTYTTSSNSVTVLVGGMQTTVIGNASTSASISPSSSPSSSPVVNTQPCNGYPELCARKYSNITMVAAHNSPFARPGNVAANQVLDVTTQLNDGIRMRMLLRINPKTSGGKLISFLVQFQTHMVNDTVYLCHSSCDLLNVGTLESYLTTVTRWIRSHPYDVVSIIIGNADYAPPKNFVDPIVSSGLSDLVYTPSKIPMARDDWPTLSSMILSGKRAVIFMDYQANQTETPWLMDEFAQIWETPFSPTDPAFPCTIQRPPGLQPQDANNRMYMANHNLNLEFNFGSLSLLIPNSAELQVTNGVSGDGSLGQMAYNCSG